MRSQSISQALVCVAARAAAQRTDAELLGRFVCDRDPVAFEALVRRHGPMVLGVCRRALGDTPDADDAFQTVWLVLVRKAQSIVPRAKVGNWLYGVAARTAAHARAGNARRRAARRPLSDVPDPRLSDREVSDATAAVDAELVRLPEQYRAVIVLCELEGQSLKHAAEQLGVPPGTVASRLSRARARLAARLKARGFAVTALSGVLAGATAPVSARLTVGTVSLLKIGSQEVPRSVSELTHGVSAAMLANKLKAIGQVVVATALAVGTVVWMASASAQPGAAPAQRSGRSVEGSAGSRPNAAPRAPAREEEADPPSDAEVLRAMPRLPRGIPHVYEEFRDDIIIVKNRLGPRVILLPLFVGASVKLVMESWDCTVHYNRTIESDFPFPIHIRIPQVQVIEVHKLKLAK